MEFRTIRQTSHIDGVNRNPEITEHDKAMVWDDNLKKVKYVLINGLSANSKTVAGYVAKGDDASAASYIWKLDGSKNPAWRLEEYLSSITKVGNSAIFTMNSGGTKTLTLGSLAWEDSITGAVTTVFGRPGDVLALSGDYTASQVTNAFDKLNDTLDDIIEGDTVKYFTASYKSKVDANTLVRHTHSNKAQLDLITNAGDGVIPTAAQISEWDTYSSGDAQDVMDTVASFIQANTGISWVYDDALNLFTPTINLGAFTTDDLPESDTKKYFTTANQPVIEISLPYASTVAGRIAAATMGIDYPTGWVLAPGTSAVDILITHGLNRRVAHVSICAVTGTEEQALFNTAAYNGWKTPDANSLLIQSLATIPKQIKIYMIFK